MVPYSNQDSSSKLELTNNKDFLYLSGPKGLTKVKVNRDTLTPVYSLKPDHLGGIMLKRNTKNQMLTQEPESNNTHVLDEQDVVRGKIAGRAERGPINENYRHYRHSLDDRYILWRNGNRDLDILDCETQKVDETVPNFWTYNGVGCQPICAVSNREVTKILGLSQLSDGTQIFQLYMKDANNKVNITTYRVKDFFPTSTLGLTSA
jgi:hypothetical protein